MSKKKLSKEIKINFLIALSLPIILSGCNTKIGFIETLRCDFGDMSGCYNLGRLEKGKGNFNEEKKLYSKACDGGNMEACWSLGWLEKNNQNISNAKNLFLKACDGGNLDGCYHLGISEDESGNYNEAKIAFSKGCDLESYWGCGKLGYMEDIKGNTSEAKKAFFKACNGFEKRGLVSLSGTYCYALAVMEVENRNITEAISMSAKFCNKPNFLCNLFQAILEQRKGNFDEAKIMFSFGCGGGACNAFYINNIDWKKEGEIFSRASCMRFSGVDDQKLCNDYGLLFEKKGNMDEARKFYSMGCDRGSIGACYNLAILEKKKGNRLKARKFFNKACNEGNYLSCDELRNLK